MARIFTEGFELGSNGTFFEYVSTGYGEVFSPTSAVTRSGVYSLVAGGGHPYAYKTIPSMSEFYTRICFRNSGDTIQTFFGWYSDGTVLGTLRWDTGKLKVYIGSSTLVSTGTTPLSLGVFYRIELHVKIDDTVGLIEVRIDGIDESSMTFNGDTKPSTETTTNKLLFDGHNNYTYFDDLAFNDTTGAVDNSWCGEGQIIYLRPNGTGDVTQLTASSGNNWECVDEVPASGNDYVYGSTVDNYDLYNLESPSILSDRTVKRVWTSSVARTNIANLGKAKLGIKSSSNEYWGNDLILTPNWLWANGTEYLTNPATGVAWTIDELGTIQVGIKARGI